MGYQVNRTSVTVLQALMNEEAVNKISAKTIADIMEVLEESKTPRNRMTVYRHLKSLVEIGYVAKGIPDDHADTFYLLDKGINLMKGE